MTSSVSATAAADLISSRRTIHNFKSEPVPAKELILRAVDLARWAPNHRLTEPWRFYLLGRETAEAIARLNADLVTKEKGAAAGRAKLARWIDIPGWMVVTCARSDDPIRSREDYAACACGIQNLALYLWSEGVGVKWTTGEVTRSDDFYDLIWVDRYAETVVGLVWYGYAREIPRPSRKPVEEILVELP